MGSMILTVVFRHVQHSATLIINGACNTFHIVSKLCMIVVIMKFNLVVNSIAMIISQREQSELKKKVLLTCMLKNKHLMTSIIN